MWTELFTVQWNLLVMVFVFSMDDRFAMTNMAIEAGERMESSPDDLAIQYMKEHSTKRIYHL